jgi:hypothetical protein
MDDQEYKRLCAQPDVMQRSVIRATIVRLKTAQPELAGVLEHILRASPLPKPLGYSGSSENDFFYLDLSESNLESIQEAIADVEVFLAQSGNGSSELEFVASLHDKWRAAESSRP